MAGHGNKKFRMPKSLLPSPKKIIKRGLYEAMWGAKTRDYGKRLKGGSYKNEQ